MPGASCKSFRTMKKIFCPLALLTGLVGVWLSGCGNQSGPPPAVKETGGSVVTAPADYVGAMAKAEPAAVKTVDTAAVKSAIQLFQADQGSWPKDLNELVEKKFLPKIPATPAGTRLDYDPKTGEVKVVKQ